MNAAQALHSAARQYCIDNHRHWCEVYASFPNQGSARDGYTPKALDTFPRYNMLNAILVAVETIDSELLDDFEKAKSLVVNAGSMADDDFTRNPLSEIAANAQRAERQKFCNFVDSLSELDVWEYDLLPYRRVLSIAESDHIWSLLGSTWSVPTRSYWYPLTETSVTDIVAFRAKEFYEFVPTRALRRKLTDLNIERVWELREYGPEYVEDVEMFDPFYNGAEGVWTTTPGYD